MIGVLFNEFGKEPQQGDQVSSAVMSQFAPDQIDGLLGSVGQQDLNASHNQAKMHCMVDGHPNFLRACS